MFVRARYLKPQDYVSRVRVIDARRLKIYFTRDLRVMRQIYAMDISN